MKSPQYYGTDPLIDEDGTTTTDVHDATRVDLRDTPWKERSAIVISAKTVNVDAPGVAIAVDYAFSMEEFPAVDAPTRLAPRKATLAANVGEAGGGILEYVSARVPITGRYLYVWWTCAANDNGNMHMTVHAIPID